MAENPTLLPLDTCQSVVKGRPCKRRIAKGERFCWQHTKGFWHKLRLLPRIVSTTIVACSFIIALIGAPAAYQGLVDWYWRRSPIPIDETHTNTTGTFDSRINDAYFTGKCHHGVAEASERVQWTWDLQGAHFGCESNNSESQATIDFDAGAAESISVGSTIPYKLDGNEVAITMGWDSPRTDGKAKWIVAVACPDDSQRKTFGWTFRDVLTILSSSTEDTTGSFTLQNCQPGSSLLIRISRRGDSAEDTLQAVARLKSIFIASFKKGQANIWPPVRPPKYWLDLYESYDRYQTEVDKLTKQEAILQQGLDELRSTLKKDLGCVDSANQIRADIYAAIIRERPEQSTKAILEEICSASSTEPHSLPSSARSRKQ